MSDSVISKIERGMEDAIAGMSEGDGYNYDWGTVNQPDVALQTFPSAEIMLESETCLDDKEGVWSDAYELESIFVLRIRSDLQNETERPAYEINHELNRALDDLKKLFGINYHVTDSCDTVMYMGATRVPDRTGDIFRPAHMDVRFRVRYTQDRQNPEINAE
jgi:hypothetical protein